jgi:uncharacterized membrane protein YGL010W
MEAIESSTLLNLKAFIGDAKVKKIEELFRSNECGVFVVAGWFVSVVEGVDMWFPALSVNFVPRYIGGLFIFLFFIFLKIYVVNFLEKKILEW